MLFSYYRKDEVHDPEIYAAAIASIFAMYPRHVVERVTDPRVGIASTCKFLPSIAEVREACDIQFGPERRHQERAALEAAQRFEAAEYAARRSAAKLSYDELKAKYPWPDARVDRERRLAAEGRAKLIAQIGQEAFDALPDLPQPPVSWTAG